MSNKVPSRSSWVARRQISAVYSDETWDEWDEATDQSQRVTSPPSPLLHLFQPHILPRTLPYRPPSDLYDQPREKDETKDGHAAPRYCPFFSDSGTAVSSARSIFKAAPSVMSDAPPLGAPVTPLQHPSLTPARSTFRMTESPRSLRPHAQPLRSIRPRPSFLPRDKLNAIDLWRHRVALEDLRPGSATWLAVLMQVGKIELRMGRAKRGRLNAGWEGGVRKSGGGGAGRDGGASGASGALGLTPVSTGWSGIFGIKWGRGKGGSYQASLGDKRAIIVPSLLLPTSPGRVSDKEKEGKKRSEVLPLRQGRGYEPKSSGEVGDGRNKGRGWWGKVKGRWSNRGGGWLLSGPRSWGAL